MKKRIFLIIIILIILLITFKLIDRKIYNNLKLKYNEDIGVYVVDNPDNLSIVDKKYQNDISKLINNQLNNKLYLETNPLMILNPYGTNITGLYINFFTFNKTKIEYTITVDESSIPDFTNTLNGGLTNYHEGQIIGLIQGYENIITIKLIDKNNNVKNKHEFKINVPNYNTPGVKKIDSSYNDLEKISDGLYMICSAWDTEQTYHTLPLSFYDVNGILRAEFTQDSGHESYRIEFINNKLLYTINKKQYVLVNHLGKIEEIYNAKHYGNHEFIYNKYNNSILYSTETDKIRQISLSNNTDKLLLDLGDLLKKYKEKSIEYHKENFNYYQNLDWAHLNSIDIVNENDIILSAREISSIIYITGINNNPEIKYIIAPETIYENTQYTKYLLEKVGDFPIHAGQHAVIKQDDKTLPKWQYYLIFYNNNYAPPDYMNFNVGWEKIIDGVGTQNKPAKNSMYYKYLVDEKEKTFTLVDSIKTPYSRMISNVQILENGYLINSGAVSTVEEYNNHKELILKLKINPQYTLYRVYKHDMKNFWFDNVYSYTKKDEFN